MALWNNTDAEISKPKYSNAAEKAITVGVDVAEAQEATNVVKGINTPGWVTYSTYVDGNGNTRHKSEVLVAMKSMTADNDALPAVTLSISVQPAADSVTAPAPGEFSVTAAATANGTITYQWEVSTDTGSTWTAIDGAVNPSLVVASTDPEYVTLNQFRVIISGPAGSNGPLTSTAVTLTIA